jgi:hypothetical protein
LHTAGDGIHAGKDSFFVRIIHKRLKNLQKYAEVRAP